MGCAPLRMKMLGMSLGGLAEKRKWKGILLLGGIEESYLAIGWIFYLNTRQHLLVDIK